MARGLHRRSARLRAQERTCESLGGAASGAGGCSGLPAGSAAAVPGGGLTGPCCPRGMCQPGPGPVPTETGPPRCPGCIWRAALSRPAPRPRCPEECRQAAPPQPSVSCPAAPCRPPAVRESVLMPTGSSDAKDGVPWWHRWPHADPAGAEEEPAQGGPLAPTGPSRGLPGQRA